VSEGITLIVVTDMALPLFKIVRRLSLVKDAARIGKDIRVTLHPVRKSKKSKAPGDSTDA
jgi:ribosome recycling factor